MREWGRSLQRQTAGFAEWVETDAPQPGTIARFALGAMVLSAGVHKLLAPAAWTIYVVDWLEPLLIVSPTVFMLINGWLEVGFGLTLLVDRYAALAALVAAVSLTATCAYLAVVGAAGGGFGDVLARDVGLAGLAWAVFVGEFRAH
ncbi:DoxX family membrane protein [Halosegnis sp.]|uniref:DoxX family membrane protein n=1 Tax=Halosegnis sp. TaxID=2864959 RepID=UPI0035D4604C